MRGLTGASAPGSSDRVATGRGAGTLSGGGPLANKRRPVYGHSPKADNTFYFVLLLAHHALLGCNGAKGRQSGATRRKLVRYGSRSQLLREDAAP